MRIRCAPHPSLSLSSELEPTLFLIKQELKSRKFFNTLRTLGLDNSHYQPHLDELILANVGLNDDANETFDFYYLLMEKHSEKIEPDNESITHEAFQVYLELMIEKKKRSQTQ